ncbi:MAG: ATP-binding protein [Muribaculaceae bacterium]|nr:ATP-binding protein [Muribaculaceae bacterium]
MKIYKIQNNHIIQPSFKAEENRPDIFEKLSAIQDEKAALIFIRQQPDFIYPIDSNGDYIIHHIVKKDFFEPLKYMLLNPTRAKVLLEQQGEGGKHPLAVAKSLRIAKLLLSKGANPLALDDNDIPAGANKILPQDFREKTIFENERLHHPALQPLKSVQQPQPQPQIEVNTTKLQSSAAETEYKKVSPTPSENNIPPQKPKISYFSMFKRKESTTTKTEQHAISNKKSVQIEGSGRFKQLDTPEISGLDDVIGLENIKNALQESIVAPVINEKVSRRLARNHTSIPNGIIISAPPGNGKTTLVSALGKEASMPVFEVSSPEELSQLIDIVGKNYDKTGQRAIIYMRGLDNLYKENEHNSLLTNDLNRCLTKTSKHGSLIVFSVECPELIPRSILTPGKIDRILSFKLPDSSAREKYIRHYIKDKEVLSKINVKKITDSTQGFSIAQLKHVIDDSVINCIANTQEYVSTKELLNRIKVFSVEQNIPEINEFNKTSMYDTVLKRYQPTSFDAENFESIAGMPTTKSTIENSILKPWKNADKLRNAKIQLPPGGIFVGDPGTSKTYMAKALARSLNLPLYMFKMSEVGTPYVHGTVHNITQIIDQLITKFDETGEASILLLDEIDNFQKGHSQHGDEEVNSLLQEIERGRNKILFIGTTNELESLPDSLIRDGRMGAVIHFEHCDEKAAGAIIKNMLSARKDNPEVQKVLENTEFLEKIAKRCNGMVAASVSEIINKALSNNITDDTTLEKAIDDAVEICKQKDIEKILSKSSKNAGHRLNISKNSTIMYDSKYPRMIMDDTDPKGLDSLGGIQELKKTLRREIIDIYTPETLELLKENKLPVTKGFILHGPPGNGKTTIVKAIANEMGLPLYQLNSGNLGSPYIHQLAGNAQEVREQLAYKFKVTGERSILFIDEAQQLIPRTSGALMPGFHNMEETSFFKDMIMSAQKDGIIYAMATNDLSQIEPAIYENSDRLGVCLYVGNPDYESRVGIIKKLIEDRPAAKEINNPEDIEKIAEIAEGLSISKLSQSILNVIRDSVTTKSPVTLENITERLEKERVQ